MCRLTELVLHSVSYSLAAWLPCALACTGQLAHLPQLTMAVKWPVMQRMRVLRFSGVPCGWIGGT